MYVKCDLFLFFSKGIFVNAPLQVPVPPILGLYSLKEEESHLRISVTLKLHESVKNNFEYCEAHLPFFNRYAFCFQKCYTFLRTI